MADELPENPRFECEAESLRQRIGQLERELQAVRQTLADTDANLKKRDDDFRTLMETVPEMVSRHRPDSTYVYVSPASQSLFGYSPEELIGRKARDYIHAEDVPRVAASAQHAFETGVQELGEYRHLTRDGSYVWVETTAKRIVGSGADGPNDLICVVRDITLRKQAEEALRASAERYRTVADFTYDWEYWLSPDRRFIYCSPACERITGYRPEEFERAPELLDSIIHPADRDRVSCHADGVRDSGPELREQEFRIVTRAGEVRWIAHACRVVRGRDAAYLGQRASNRDITERKRAEEDLKRYQNIVSSTQDGIAFLDEDYRYVIVNDSYVRSSGMNRESFVGLTVAEYLGEDVFHRHIKPRFDRCLRGEIINYQEWFDYPALGRKFADVTYFPYRDSDNRIVGVVADTRDLTERKLAEEALRESENRLRTLLNAVQAGVILQGKDGRITHVNDIAARIFGMEPQAALGRTSMDPLWQMIDESGASVPADAHPSMITLRTGQPVRNAIRGLFSGDPVAARWLLINTEPLFQNDRHEVDEVLITFLDITEIKRMQEEVRAERDFAESLLNTAPAIILVLDPEGRIVRFNPYMEAISGYSLGEVWGKDCFNTLVPAARRDPARDQFRKALLGTQTRGKVDAMITKSGEERLIEWYDKTLEDADGSIMGLLATGQDVTERTRVEAEIEKLAKFLSENPNPVLRIAGDGVLLYINAAGSDHFSDLHLQVGQVVPRMFREVVSRSMADGMPQALEIEHQGRVYSFFVAPVVDERYTNLYGRDITASVRGQEALRESEERFQQLFDHMADGVAVYQAVDEGQDFVMVDLNSTAEALSHIRCEEVVGRRVTEVFPAVEGIGLLDVFRRVWRTGHAEHHPLAEYADGRIELWVENYVFRLPSGLIVAIYSDTSEKHRADEALAEYRRQLQALACQLTQTEDRERRRIAAYLHDQVGQSLAAARVRFATWKRVRSPSTRQMLLAEIEHLIDQTIDNTRLLTFDLSPPVLFELGLGPAIEWLGESLFEKEGIAFRFLDDGHSGKIDEVLASALYRTVRELLTNALKHAQARQVSVSVSADDRDIRLIVKDDGVGMERIRFEQTLKGLGGTYGLFSIRERLQHLNGSLVIESNPGEGTCATVTAPLSHSV